MCRDLVGMLARKRPASLAGGDRRVWAAAVIYGFGANNFLFGQASEPFLSGERPGRAHRGGQVDDGQTRRVPSEKRSALTRSSRLDLGFYGRRAASGRRA